MIYDDKHDDLPVQNGDFPVRYARRLDRSVWSTSSKGPACLRENIAHIYIVSIYIYMYIMCVCVIDCILNHCCF